MPSLGCSVGARPEIDGNFDHTRAIAKEFEKKRGLERIALCGEAAKITFL